MNKIVFLLFMLWFSSQLMCQTAIVKGYITSQESGELLIGAVIYVNDGTSFTLTNDYGYFSVPFSNINDTLSISFLGYNKLVLPIKTLNLDQPLDIALERSSLIDEVVITSNANYFKQKQYFKTSDLAKVPSVIQQDLFRSLHALPGIQTGSEGQVAMHVRGGNSDHNLILLNHAPLFNPSHGLGFFSTINPDAVNSFQFMKDNFPVEFGGRSASIMNINLNRGNLDSLQSSFSIGLLSADLNVSGPIQKGKTSFFIGARRSYIDILSKGLLALAENSSNINPSVNFYDINFNLSHKLDINNVVSYYGYLSRDRFSLDLGFNSDENEGINSWMNNVHSLGWNSVLSNGMFLNSTAYISKYNSRIRDIQSVDINDVTKEFTTFSSVQNLGVKSVLEISSNERHYIKVGFETLKHDYTPLNIAISERQGNKSISSQTLLGSETDLVEASLFASDKFSFGQSSLFLGLRYTHLSNVAFNSLQPRVSFSIRLFDFDFNISYDKMLQTSNRVSSSRIALPTDIIVPPTTDFLPLESQQLSIGLFRKINKISFSINPYYKLLDGVLEYKEGFSLFDQNSFEISGATSWEESVTQGQGETYGTEVSFSKKGKRLNLILNYTYSKATRLFSDLNDNDPFPFRFNRGHVIDFLIDYSISDKSSFNVAWNFGSGQYVSIPQFLVPLDFETFFIPPDEFVDQFYEVYSEGSRNSIRMSPYHRLDLSYKRNFFGKWFDSILTVGVYNAYNRANPYSITAFYSQISKRAIVDQISIFPYTIPSITYTIKLK